MKIGIFTDTYYPSVNGVVTVVSILRRSFEALGHEVFVFAPGESLKITKTDDHLIKFPTVKGFIYSDVRASLFFPPFVIDEIEKLNLDVIHFLTPGQIGLMGLYAAHELKKPLVSEYCTDLFEYVEHYPLALPALLAGMLLLPFAIPLSREELLELAKAGRPRLGIAKWNKSLVKDFLTILHSSCDAVVVHSRRSARQLAAWQNGEFSYRTYLIPTGVDPLPKARPDEIAGFKKRFKIDLNDKVVMYVGRLSSEKNLDLLIKMMPILCEKNPEAKLVFVGDFDYRPVLEQQAKDSPAANRITFTGLLPREKLGQAFGAADVFAFPSISDTQGLVLHEAAGYGLPIVAIDRFVSEIIKDGENGFFSKNNPESFARSVAKILNNQNLKQQMGANSKALADNFNELGQSQKLISLYKKIIRRKSP